MSAPGQVPHSRPSHDRADEEAAIDALRAGMTASGPRALELGRLLQRELGGAYAVAAPSGTLALAMALRSLDIVGGDDVLCPTYVCMEVRDAIHYVGARCVPCDIDPETFSLSAATAQAARTPRTRAVVLPHMFGVPADVSGVLSLGVPVVEDLAQGLGARVADRPAGSFGAASILSFRAIKVLSSGDGGAVVVREASAAARLEALHRRVRPDQPSWFFPMSDVTAGIALSQWSRLTELLDLRRALAIRYLERLSPLEAAGVVLPRDGGGRAWYRFPIRPPRGVRIDDIKARMARRGIQVRRPVDPPMHRALGLPLAAFPAAEEVYEATLSLPIYPTLSEADQDRVIAALSEALAEAAT
jgi:dTDP-4-amino-4,6-dideoxygalactose transaminase